VFVRPIPVLLVFVDLFSASLDVGWRPDNAAGAAEGATRPAAMLTVANNDVTRVMASLESLMFQSCVSPQVAIRCGHQPLAACPMRAVQCDAGTACASLHKTTVGFLAGMQEAYVAYFVCEMGQSLSGALVVA
jgi:hypothetical protein